MSLLNILILGIVQGLAELLPVSSSAHVVVTEELLGLDPSSPPMTLLLVMLHTGTMFAVIAYFWRSWRERYFRTLADFRQIAMLMVLATALTGLVGGAATLLVEHVVLRGVAHAQVEDLFDHLELIAPALAAVGVLIIVAGLSERRRGLRLAAGQTASGPAPAEAAARSVHGGLALLAAGAPAPSGTLRSAVSPGLTPAAPAAASGAPVAASGAAAASRAQPAPPAVAAELSVRQASIIGAVQGLALPFRGFSRSGATISAGMLCGVAKERAEIFSFALAVVLTPPVVAREALRLVHAGGAVLAGGESLAGIVARTLFGALVAFIAGLAALRWLSGWLERGRWHLFGIYCLIAAAVVGMLHHLGY
jgi:undecaprenyl-diphosphatase